MRVARERENTVVVSSGRVGLYRHSGRRGSDKGWSRVQTKAAKLGGEGCDTEIME